jgi:hypothetical protein
MPRELVTILRLSNPGITFPALGAPGEGALAPPVSSSPVSSPDVDPAAAGRALPEGRSGSPELQWLMVTLQAAMEGVMAGEATPLQKANAVARLAGQYLKAYGLKELERENQALNRRLAAAEARVAALEAHAVSVERPATAMAGAAVPPAGDPEQELEWEGDPCSMDGPDEPWMTRIAEESLAVRHAEAHALGTAGATAQEGRGPP